MDNFKDSFDEDTKDITSTGFFKFKEGDNKLRILSAPSIKVSRWGHGVCYKDAPYCSAEALDKSHKQLIEKALAEGKKASDVKKPSLAKKWSCWAINRVDGEMVILDLPYKITKMIRDLMDNEDYKFEGFPMPYDITVNAKNAGKKIVEYIVIAARNNTELTVEEKEAFDKLTPMDQIIDRMKAKAKEKVEGSEVVADTEEYPDDDIKPEDIPFDSKGQDEA